MYNDYIPFSNSNPFDIVPWKWSHLRMLRHLPPQPRTPLTTRTEWRRTKKTRALQPRRTILKMLHQYPAPSKLPLLSELSHVQWISDDIEYVIFFKCTMTHLHIHRAVVGGVSPLPRTGGVSPLPRTGQDPRRPK